MATQISFIKNIQGFWETSFVSNGNCMALEITREKPGNILVYGNIEGMNKILIDDYGPGADCNQLIEVDVPNDETITIVSYTEVTSAKIV